MQAVAARGRDMSSEDKLLTLTAEFERLAERGIRSAPEMGRLVEELHGEFATLMRERHELASLYDVASELAAASDLSALLESIIEKAIVLVRAERGFVVVGEGPQSYYLGAARRYTSGDAEPTNDMFSSSLIRKVMTTLDPILTTNVQADARFELSQSIIMQDIRSVLAVPLVARGELQGAVYVDTRMSARNFDERDLHLLQGMASQAAMAIRGARLFDDVRVSNEQLQKTVDELREAQAQLVQAERLAAVGRLAASVAHELRNPLMVMRSGLYFLDRIVSEGPVDSPEILRRYFKKLDTEIDRQSKIINDLLFFSRNRPRKLTAVSLNSLLHETLMRIAMPESVAVVRLLDAELPQVHADPDQLQQVFVNLVTNAIQAMPEGGKLTVVTRNEGDFAVVQVQDTGVGMTAEEQSHLFQPFFTTKQQGIGLGLAVSQSIVEGHRGAIAVQSAPGIGTQFEVRLPFELIG